METIESIITAVLTAGGFTPCTEEHLTDTAKLADTMFGVGKVKKHETARTVQMFMGDKFVQHDYTVALRCFGKRCGFSDASQLAESISRMVIFLVNESGLMVKGAERGEITRCAALGRLETTVIFRVTGRETIEREAENGLQ